MIMLNPETGRSRLPAIWMAAPSRGSFESRLLKRFSGRKTCSGAHHSIEEKVRDRLAIALRCDSAAGRLAVVRPTTLLGA